MKFCATIQPKFGRDANLILLEAVVGGRTGNLQLLPPLIVHNDDGSCTDEVKRIYGA